VVLTAAVDAGRPAAEIGAEGYLAKPFNLHELLAVISRYLPRG
jgi:DNA-binding response OmpR family regulator